MATDLVFLTFNDTYVLDADHDGCGGIAEFATLLKNVRDSIPSTATTIVTMNGDFLWRSEQERRDKGAHMVELLNTLPVEYVVLGNHEFDFGEVVMRDLLSAATFTIFGSNVRLSATGEIFPGVTDVVMRELPNGAVLGMFGVTTSNSALDSFASDAVAFESEVRHARRCVALLKARGADVIVALTHLRIREDRLIARSVEGIDLILGGHDHEPTTMIEGGTLIHKSGFNALWLGRINLRIGLSSKLQQQHGRAHVSADWTMYLNRGYDPDPIFQGIRQRYVEQVTASAATENSSTRVDKPLTTLTSMLDGSKATLRASESNLGNLVTDAMLAVYDADIAILNAGAIRCERMFIPPMQLTRAWVNSVVSDANHVAVVKMRVLDLQYALLEMLGRYPTPNSSHPQISGAFLVLYDDRNQITSVNFFRDRECTRKIDPDETLLVVTTDFLRDRLEGRAFFAESSTTKHVFVTQGYIQDVVEAFLKQHETIEYPLCEHRQRIEWIG